jgi:hypothetical protein
MAHFHGSRRLDTAATCNPRSAQQPTIQADEAESLIGHPEKTARAQFQSNRVDRID